MTEKENERGADTKTARDLAGAEVALKRAGWGRATELRPAPNPATFEDCISQFEKDWEALEKIAGRFAPKKNPIVEFFDTDAGTEAMKSLIPVLTEKLFGGGDAVKENPSLTALNERVARIEVAVAQIVKALKTEE